VTPISCRPGWYQP